MKAGRWRRAALAATVVLIGAAGTASAQESRFRLNPYAGWYHFDESSFEEAFETSDVESDPVYGLRLAIGGIGGWSLDLAYGRTKFDAQDLLLSGGDETFSTDATIQLFYGALNWHLPLTGPLDLFLSGGLGGIDSDFEGEGGGTDVLLNYGAGVAIPVGSLRVRADLKDQVDFCDAPEEFDADALDACFEDDALHNIELTGGIEIPL
jgi:hypothetical protein